MRAGLLVLTLSLGLSACSRDRDLPEPYRRLAVPRETLASGAARERGRRLYVVSCVLCHGERADGRGPRREGFTLPPRDFTSPAWKKDVTPRRVFFAIREGLAGTPMPAWKSLSEAETWDVVAFILAAGEATP